MTAVIGIDPGQTGAMALLIDGRVESIYDMPTSARLHGKGQQIDASDLASMLRGAMLGCDLVAKVEAVSAMPGQGVSSMFRFGESIGIIIGVLGTLGIPYQWVTPARWKKSAGLIGKDKDAARTLAIQLHPECADRLTRKKDVGRADSVLIARFG
jgi:crossover junction endodeoxyribonuclease RuvC